MQTPKRRIAFSRRVLLIEIERRCSDPLCNARTRIGLTKEEARLYNSFKCERCERRTNDILGEQDVPEWWEELAIASLDEKHGQLIGEAYQPSEAVTRMSDAYRLIKEADEENSSGENSL